MLSPRLGAQLRQPPRLMFMNKNGQKVVWRVGLQWRNGLCTTFVKPNSIDDVWWPKEPGNSSTKSLINAFCSSSSLPEDATCGLVHLGLRHFGLIHFRLLQRGLCVLHHKQT